MDRRALPWSPRGFVHRASLRLAIAVVMMVAAGAAAGPGWVHAAPASPTPQVTIAAGSAAYTITVAGRNRTYRIYRPAGVADPAPLVVMIHGGGGSGAIAERFYGWDKLADQHRFIVAYPDGLGPAVPAWNTEGGCCGYPAREKIDDVAFITAMVDRIRQEIPIDPNRVYATGISNGGMLDYTLACTTDLFAAIGPVSATMLNPCPDPRPLSVVHIHGLQDTSIRFEGGIGQGTAKINGPPVPSVIAAWRTTDQCAAPASSTKGVVTISTANCPAGRAVELVTIADAGHGWPGAPLKSAQSTVGGRQPSQALDATSVIWQFFAAHPKQ